MGLELDEFIIENEVRVRVQEVVVKPPKSTPRVCRCKSEGCLKLTKEAEETLRKCTKDQIDRNTYILRLIRVCKTKRAHDWKICNASRRKNTVEYTVPDMNENGTPVFLKVCKATFMRVFDISKKNLRLLITKRSSGQLTCTDNRKNNGRPAKYSADDIISNKRHIEKFPIVTSHYGSMKSSDDYLSPDLNFTRMYRKYREENPESTVSRKFFPKLKFKQLRVVTCRTCNLLNVQIQANNKDSPKARRILEEHHNAVNQARKEFANERQASVLPDTSYSVATIDLQQVYSIPTLTHSDI